MSQRRYRAAAVATAAALVCCSGGSPMRDPGSGARPSSTRASQAPPPSPIPSGYRALTPQLIVADITAAASFCERAFGARTRRVLSAPGGRQLLGEIALGDALVLLVGEDADRGARTPAALGAVNGRLYVYVDDVDQSYQRAVAAGATVRQPPTDSFWGDRIATVADPDGHHWTLARRTEVVAADVIARRAAAAVQAMAAGQPAPELERGPPPSEGRPEGYSAVTAHLALADARTAIAYYQQAFAATVVRQIQLPDGRTVHAELQIGNSRLMVASHFPEANDGMVSARDLGRAPLGLVHYVDDADRAFARATEAGASAAIPVTPMFWGDRYGMVVDPEGVEWSLATRVEEVGDD